MPKTRIQPHSTNLSDAFDKFVEPIPSTKPSTKPDTKKDLKDIPDSSKSGKSRLKDYEKDNRFMSFYQAYPRKVDPHDAHKAFKAVIGNNDELLKTILNDIEQRKKNHTQWADKQYIKYPATYLRKGEYLGEIINIEIEIAEKKEKEKELIDKNLKEQERQSILSMQRELHEQELIHQDGKAFRSIKRSANFENGLNNLRLAVGLKGS